VSEVRIAAESRNEFGKGASRRLRRAGKIPAVIYGHGSDPVHVALPGHELTMALKHANVLLDLQLDSGSQLTLPKSVQRDPVRHDVEHVDLVIVNRGEKVTVEVPVTTVGIAEPGSLTDHADTLSVLAEATHIPSEIEVSIAGLPIGTMVHASEVTLPEGVELAADPEFVVVHIIGAQTAEPTAAEAAAEGEDAAGAEAGEA
jgi:large subunit ribosomal protein L25